MVQVGSGRLIAKLNELGGLPMAGPLSHYTLRVLDNYDRGEGKRKQKAAAAHPDAIVSQLALQLLHLKVEHEAREGDAGGGPGGGGKPMEAQKKP